MSTATEKVLNHVAVTTTTSENLLFVVQCFGFLLPRNSATDLQSFAALIKKHFDASNPKTLEAVNYLEHAPATLLIESNWQGFKITNAHQTKNEATLKN